MRRFLLSFFVKALVENLKFRNVLSIGVAWVRKLEGLNVFPKNHTRSFSNWMNNQSEHLVWWHTLRMWDSCESVLYNAIKKLKGKLYWVRGAEPPDVAIFGNFQLKYVLKFQKYWNFKILCFLVRRKWYPFYWFSKKLGGLKPPPSPPWRYATARN